MKKKLPKLAGKHDPNYKEGSYIDKRDEHFGDVSFGYICGCVYQREWGYPGAGEGFEEYCNSHYSEIDENQDEIDEIEEKYYSPNRTEHITKRRHECYEKKREIWRKIRGAEYTFF